MKINALLVFLHH